MNQTTDIEVSSVLGPLDEMNILCNFNALAVGSSMSVPHRLYACLVTTFRDFLAMRPANWPEANCSLPRSLNASRRPSFLDKMTLSRICLQQVTFWTGCVVDSNDSTVHVSNINPDPKVADTV